MTTHTIRLHRIIRAEPAKVFRAFTEAAAMAKWNAPHGFTCTIEHLDARAGGAFRMAFTNFSSGKSHSFGGVYRELVPGERLVYSDRFDDPSLPGEMITTVTLRPVIGGTELNLEQAGVPAAIPAEMCYLGWQESLGQLAQLVEPVIPDC